MQIPRELIDADADKVVRRLSRHGHKAYLVGGCVRDLLLEREPKDFDVSTSATPKEIRSLFRNCRIIGRRFTLAHIFFGQKIIETSTFRANPRDGQDADGELLIRRDNVFGSDTEDARRRDFTINGLFYDVEAEQVIDHVDGLKDLESRLVRTIGDPNIRFREDPVRMLRAIKFAARLDFGIGDETYEAILRHRGEITKCAAPRVLEEVYRLLRGGAAARSMELLIETGVAAMLSTRLTATLGGGVPLAPGSSGKPKSSKTQPYPDEESLWAATWADDFASNAPTNQDSDVPPTPLSPAVLDLGHLPESDDIESRRRQLWSILNALDEKKHQREELSNSLLLALVCAPFVDSILEPGVRPAGANSIVIEVLGPLVEQLHVARRDAERARQILIALRRLAPSKRRRGKPSSLLGRDYVEDAITAYELFARARGDEDVAAAVAVAETAMTRSAKQPLVDRLQ